jgi:diguanylate cyclase (GGDEF)-like protein
MAKRLFGVPIALVSLVDANRQWFKSCIGLDASQTPRSISFCGHAILSDDALVIPDATLDERFHDNPLVTGAPNIRFYAGQPLVLADGSRLGTLCIISPKPRNLDQEDRQLLRDLGKMVEEEIEALNLATICELTGLANRRGFLALGRQALYLCTRSKFPATIVYFDLDDFKSINDRFGRAEGDRALKDFAQLQKSIFRSSDVIGRLGGDEFAVLMTNCNEDQCQSALDRLQDAINKHNRSNPCSYKIAFSAGTLGCDVSLDAPMEMLLRAADELMFVNKRIRQMGK